MGAELAHLAAEDRRIQGWLEDWEWQFAPAREYARKRDGAGEARLIALVCSMPPESMDREALHRLSDKLEIH